MEIALHYTFTATVVRKRARLQHTVRFTQTAPLSVAIPERTAADLALAFEIVPIDDSDGAQRRRIHFWDGRLWEAAYVQQRDRSPLKPSDLPMLLAPAHRRGEVFDADAFREIRENDEAKVRRDLIDRAARYLIADGAVFEQVDEPRYHVRASRFIHGDYVTVEVVDSYAPSESRDTYFRADNEAAAIAYAEHTRAERGAATVDRYERIVVHEPSAVRCRPDEDGVATRRIVIDFSVRGRIEREVRLPVDASDILKERAASALLRGAAHVDLLAVLVDDPTSRTVVAYDFPDRQAT